MTCHVALRVGEFERRLRRDRREVCHALVTTDAELAGMERPHDEGPIDEAARDATCKVLVHLQERDRHTLAEVDATIGVP
jgi:hypothetical protein